MAESLKQYIAAAERLGMSESRLEWILDRVSTSRFVSVADSRQEAEANARAELATPRYATTMYGLPVGDPGFTPIVPPQPPLSGGPEELAFAIHGTTDDVIGKIEELEGAGLRQVSINLAFRSPMEISPARFERFTRDVLPVFHESPVASAR